MPNKQPSHALERRAIKAAAMCMTAPLLAFALTNCGGKASSNQTASGGVSIGGESSAGSTANGGSSAVGGADFWPDAGIENPKLEIPNGGAPASLPEQCNALERTAPPITWSVVADNPPKPKGGALSNGIYRLSKREDFVGPGGSSSSRSSDEFSTLAISASTAVNADLQIRWQERGGELPLAVGQNQTIVVSGTSYAYTVTCTTEPGFDAAGSVPFTATTDELILFHSYDAQGITRLDTYTRQ